MKDFKIKKVTDMPKCDFCKEKDGIYDGQTFSGSWANMCDDCLDQNADRVQVKMSGIKRELHVPAEPKNDGRVVKGIDTNMEEVITMDEMREVKCPDCGELRNVEPDADYTFTCEGCGVKVKVEDIMMSMF